MTDVLWLSITLDPADSEPLYMQLYAAMRAMIEDGRLNPGDRLPSSRSFAAELGISRSTVVGAIEQLTAEGYVAGRRGSGVRVSDSIDGVVRASPAHRPTPLPPLPPTQQQAAAPGLPDPRLFPRTAWKNAVLQAVRSSLWDWIEEPDPQGSPRLRRVIAAYLAERRDLKVDPQDVIVTSGARGAIYLALTTLMQPGDVIALENPSHPGIRALLERHGFRIMPLSVDHEGARIDALAQMRPSPRLVVLTPSNQYPLGGALCAGRRQSLIKWAEQTGALILEDDYDSEFRYVGRPLPPLAAGAASDRILYVGSFSKVLSPALSLGYLALPKGLRELVHERRASSDRRPSAPSQAPLAILMETGEFGRHLRRMRRNYAERRTALLGALREIRSEYLVPVDRAAGMHLVVTFGSLLRGFDDAIVAKLATDAGFNARPLSAYYFAAPAERGLLIGFSSSTPDEIRSAAHRFADALEALAAKLTASERQAAA